MFVVEPYAITSANLFSSSVPENDYPVHNMGTTYALGDRVILPSTHRIYKSLVAANVGNDPITQDTKWLDEDATNRYKMFDTSVSSQTVSQLNTPLVVVFNPADLVDTLGLINLKASSVTIEMRDSSGVSRDIKTFELFIPNAMTTWEYAFQKIKFKEFLVVENIPPYADGKLYVTINPAGDGYARVGFCLIGQAEYIGNMQYGSGGGLRNFSDVTTILGVDKFTVRQSTGKRSVKTMVDQYLVDRTVRILQDKPAKVCLWSGTNIYEAENIMGFLTDFTYTHPNTGFSLFDLSINGIT